MSATTKILAALLLLSLGAHLGALLRPRPVAAGWNVPTSGSGAQAYRQGQAATQVGEAGTLATSSIIDVTGSDSLYASAFELCNDGTASIYVQAGVASVAAMTVASHEVKAGEKYRSPVRARKYVLYAPSGSPAYRVRSAY